ncbi:MAG: lipocalin family protein [Sulfurimonadaceae bacterium]|nr:lipocalin family protein [Sulfurimonadaceae bacterium]
MKLFMTPFIFAVMLFASAPAPVAHVDAKRFSGLWYEIARTYNSFEKDCVAATVEYTLVEPLEYRVDNRCFDTVIGGDLIRYKGSAKPAEGSSMSRIDMTYFWIFTQEYRVIYLEPDYTSAVVVDDAMEQVWIMHREPFMATNRLERILSMLDESMDLSRLIFTPQDEEGRYK